LSDLKNAIKTRLSATPVAYITSAI
jgi:hypothetical protein